MRSGGVGCQCPTLNHSYRIPNCKVRIRCSFSSPSIGIPSSKVAVDPNSSSSRLDCVVVGAGISGLCIAQMVAKKYPNLIVTEARDRVGGNLNTVEKDGYLWEEGPNSFQPSDATLKLIVDSGLKEKLVLGDPKAPRFVFWEGNLRPVPSKLTDLPFFDLMSFPGKIRVAFSAICVRPPPVGVSLSPALVSDSMYNCNWYFCHYESLILL